MRKHLGRREREARKKRNKCAKRGAWNFSNGGVTLNLGRKKFSEVFMSDLTTLQLKKKFPGCVVDAER